MTLITQSNGCSSRSRVRDHTTDRLHGNHVVMVEMSHLLILVAVGRFNNYHEEKVASAVDRYVKEIDRVTAVLEGHLQKQKAKAGEDGPWLVGNKYSYADVSFVVWQLLATTRFRGELFNPDKYPAVKDWLRRMVARKAVREVLEAAEWTRELIKAVE